MDSSQDFNSTSMIEDWVNRLKSEDSLTEADIVELESHLRDIMDDLTENGLSEEEAFIIASRRMGTILQWEEEYRQENNSILQTRKSVIILSGVLFYFIFYYFVAFSSKSLFVILLKSSEYGILAVEWTLRYIVASYFLGIVLFIAIYRSEKIVMSFLKNVRLKPKHTLILVLIMFLLGMADLCLTVVAKTMLAENLIIRNNYIRIYNYFELSFPFLICSAFILIYYKYYRLAKI